METSARQPISDERKEVFLEVLRRTGSVCHAASSASPHCGGDRPGYSGFRDLARKDPEFARAVSEAKAEALGQIEAAIAKRAVEGWERPIFQRGQLVGTERCYDTNLMLRYASRLDPAWSEKRQLEVEGKVEHNYGGVMLSISPDDVLKLEPAEQTQLVALIEKIGKLKGSEDGTENQKFLGAG